MIVTLLVGALALGACGEDGPGDSAEELCCACVNDNSCGGASFSFGECVFEAYHGNVDLEIDAACVSSSCSNDCENAQFQ